MLSKARGAVMNILGPRLRRAAVLDLFAGTGALGLEAISRGASHAIAIESGREAVRLLRHNAAHCRLEAQIQIVEGDAYRLPLPLEARWPFDVVFVDPPYPDLENGAGLERLRALLAELEDRRRLADDARVVVHLPVRDLADRVTPGCLRQADDRVYGSTEILFLAPP